MNRLLRSFSHFLTSDVFHSILSGGVAACCLVGIVAPWRSMLATSAAADLGLLLTAVICLGVLRSIRIAGTFARKLGSLNLVIAAICGMAAPILLPRLLQGMASVSLLSLESFFVQTGIVLALGFITMAPTVSAIGLTFLGECRRDAGNENYWMVSFASCTALVACGLLPFVGATTLSGMALVAAGLLIVWERWIGNRTESDTAQLPQSAAGNVSWNSSVMAVFVGATLALALSMTSQLIPRSLITDSCLFAGVMLFWGISAHFGKGTRPQFQMLWLGVAAWVAILAAGYLTWTWLCLQMNAHVSSVSMLMLLRGMLLVALVCPAGLLLCRSTPFTRPENACRPLLIVMGFAGTWMAPVSAQEAAVLIGSMSLALAGVNAVMNRTFFPVGLWQRSKLIGLSLIAVCGLVFSSNLNSRVAEKILFSSPTLQMARQGHSIDKLSWLDDGRLVTSFDSMQTRMSLWKYRGAQLVFRQNGLSTGMYSTTSNHAPQSAADVLPMLLPLAFHSSPEDVLVLGIHPSALLTCQNYPLRLVRTLDGNSTSHQMLSWLNENVPEWNLTGGPEFQFGQIDPSLGVFAAHGCLYDLVVCPLTHPATPEAVTQTSIEFYRAAAKQLKQDGIFAQRIPYYDLGPEVIRTISGTLRSVFTDVMMVESIPGELVFLCSPTALPKIDEQLVNRLKTPQCRRLLGESGWDWSMVVGRGGLSTSSIDELIGKQPQINLGRDARWCSGLTIEVCRWGAKANQTRDQLAQFGDALRSALPEESIGQEVSHRLEDLNLAHQLQMNHPNDPWGYRKAIKDRLQDRPRTALVNVSYEGLKRVLDPEDRRRKEYLTALGDVTRETKPTPEMIQQLTSYEEPFDPLVTLFVHHESIQFMNRCETPDWDMQYRNLLKTIYFANSQDQSVRNVTNALDLVSQNESLQLSTTERWDHANSLMQALAQRWQMRWQSGRTSKYDGVDTEQSVAAVERAMDMLAQLAPQCGLTSSDWAARKECLEEEFVRPLRQKRSAHLRKVSLSQPTGASPTETAPVPPPTR